MVQEIIAAIVLAVVQGLTEWFPVSSSGHIVLAETLLGYSGGLLFNVALHFGTLMAVFVYFGRDITDMLRDFLSGRWATEQGRMAWLLVVASIPAAAIGYVTADFFESVLTDLIVVAFGFGITGLFLLIASVDFTRHVDMQKFGYGRAFLVGIAQALSIVPGISRSGSTMAASVLLGLSEKHAMKFAFLMSIPIIFGANILTVGNATLPPALIWATLASFGVGLLSIHLVFKYVLTNRKNFRWFALYCLILAGILVLWNFLH